MHYLNFFFPVATLIILFAAAQNVHNLLKAHKKLKEEMRRKNEILGNHDPNCEKM